ncbi:MAG TPA: hypothetical protein PKN32_05205 [Bacteroidales bacterium]|nr:hypothetical protein [Bacteroidales bacterium]
MREDSISKLALLVNFAFAQKFIFHTYKFDFQHVYRGRKFEYSKNYNLEKVKKKVTNIKDMWAPPARYASNNRCNRAGDPKLYLTTLKKAIPFELRYELGDKIAIITYKSIEQLNKIAVIGCKQLMQTDEIFKDIFIYHLKDKSLEVKQIEDMFANFYIKPKDYNMKQHEWFLKKYNLPIDLRLYDLTIAVSENYLNSGVHGLIYPCVAQNFKSANFVLQPEQFAEILKPTAIEIYDSFILKDNNNVVTRLLSSGYFENSGNISWSDSSTNNWIEWE